MYLGIIGEFLNMGGSEIMLILAVVLLLFGGKKLPELARGLGKGIRDFKDASEGVKREIHRNINAMDIDDELRAEERTASTSTSTRTPTQTLEDQMYPKTEVKEPIDLNKEAAPAETTDIAAAAEKMETEKNKTN
ncbi:Sec-independent protein translocase subunit TatA/TatB [Pedobacter sp. AW31-3R]|uniref:Sec-independent protein translocase subunit TatA/TatB n=1 Tax=Pedobacter sp. AW31-3R TaxID=3445781 RepID=UPI003FA169EB